MNIFEYYLSEIHKLVLKNKVFLQLENIDNLVNVNLEIPPEQFNFDLSCNISLVLAKSNKINPKDLATKIKDLFLVNIKHFEKIEIAGPGFLNIKLSKEAMVQNLISIFKNKKNYGSKKSNETYNIVS